MTETFATRARKQANELAQRLEQLAAELATVWEQFQLEAKQQQLNTLEHDSQDVNFWRDPATAQKTMARLARLKEEIEPWQLLRTQVQDLQELIDLRLKEEIEPWQLLRTQVQDLQELIDLSARSPELLDELSHQLDAMQREFATQKKALRFTGPFDDHDAILRITAGAGGTEAMDWAGMLERMYLRWAERRGYRMTLIERVAGEEAGIKTAVYQVAGPHAYGWLKGEHGTHRLVRQSPFNADHLRQTSFAGVEILPVTEPEDLKIDDKDLRIDVYRSGGHGGQGVNTTDSAVRITHLPTNTVVTVQNERSQQQNRAQAMEILRGRLLQMQKDQHAESLADLRAGESASWGQQIRNYVLHPYKLVKDTRTGFESKDPDAMLDGDLDALMENLVEYEAANVAQEKA